MASIIEFNGHTPEVASGAFLAPTATVIGQAQIAEGASIFYGAVVRADSDLISIGPDTNIQDNVVLHTDAGIQTRLGRGVSVGHSAVVHGATVDDHCLIGMHATLLNRCHIGSESLIAAGALVTEGTIIPPRSLVAGVPAKVRRTLTDEEVEGLHTNANVYLSLAKEHSAANS